MTLSPDQLGGDSCKHLSHAPFISQALLKDKHEWTSTHMLDYTESKHWGTVEPPSTSRTFPRGGGVGRGWGILTRRGAFGFAHVSRDDWFPKLAVERLVI
ncbi:hypothetical protein HanRHA438_Chr12g0569741 [Helianthus annuus]|nr:hypothetical protein HanRHA438_Chr12g0569741 [Helianthus annuus]